MVANPPIGITRKTLLDLLTLVRTVRGRYARQSWIDPEERIAGDGRLREMEAELVAALEMKGGQQA